MDIRIADYGKLITIKIVGDFYIGNIKQLEDIWNEAIEKRPEVIGFNCKDLKFIDSSAIGTLVKFLNSADRFEIDMVFYDLSKSIVRIFKTAKLVNLFKIVTSTEFEDTYLEKYS